MDYNQLSLDHSGPEAGLSLGASMLLQQAILKVREERGEGDTAEVTVDALTAIYHAISNNEVEADGLELAATAMMGHGEVPKDDALRFIESTRDKLEQGLQKSGA